MGRRIIQSRAFKWGSIIFGSYWVLAYFIPASYLIQYMNHVLTVLSLVVIYRFWPSVWDGLRSDRLDPVKLMIMGISLRWLSDHVGRDWITIWRLDPVERDWMRVHAFIGFYTLIAIVAGFLHVAASDGSEGRRFTMATGVAVSVIAAVILLLITLAYGELR